VDRPSNRNDRVDESTEKMVKRHISILIKNKASNFDMTEYITSNHFNIENKVYSKL
jgi:hypothetical protein